MSEVWSVVLAHPEPYHGNDPVLTLWVVVGLIVVVFSFGAVAGTRWYRDRKDKR